MAYFAELRAQWRPLLAAMIGLGSGFSLTMYTTSIMAPNLLREFGWSKSEFALVGSLSIFTFAALPLVGRLADSIGVRRTALIGVIAIPVVYLLLSLMTGPIWQYIALFVAQSLICVTTTTTVYSRIVVQYVKKARGLALAIVASGPAITGAIGGPLLNNFVEAHGWRAGYVALMVFAGLAGAAALLLMPTEKGAVAAAPRAGHMKRDYAEIAARPAFWIILIAMLLCNLPQVIALTQLKLVLLDNGVTATGVSGMISAFAIGTLIGRFASGVALDRYPAHLVSLVGMGLPSIGLFLLASPFDTPAVILTAVLLFGLSFGAEGDIVGYLVVRSFGVRVYSSVLGLMTAAIMISSSIGAALLSLTLKLTGGYALFLNLSAASVAVGSLIFLLLGRGEHDVKEAVAQAG